MAEVGDEAVFKATGKTWKQWFRFLDARGAGELDHKSIVKLLRGKVSPWWEQMVTVSYEQERGLRDKHEKPAGYEIGRSKTVSVALDALYRAWSDKRARRRWLKDFDFTVRKSTKNRSMRITWTDGRTHVDANFYGKGESKSQVGVQHKKLANARQAERMKGYWAEQLARLKEMLEEG